MTEATPKILPNLSVFEAESMLLEAMGALKNPEKIEPLKNILVGDFWENTWRRAPFEECLTFKQLASLNPDILIKKRSFDTEKMVALSYAIKRALNSEHTKALPTPPSSPILHIPSRAVEDPKKLSWKTPFSTISSTMRLFLLGFAEEIAQLPGQHSFAKIGGSILSHIPPEQFAAVWFSALFPDEDTFPHVGLEVSLSKKSLKETCNAIYQLMSETTPELSLHWSTALTGAGASETTLFSAYKVDRPSENLIRDLGRVLITALGAKPVQVASETLHQHWSTSPETAHKIIEALLPGLSSKKSQAIDTLSLPFPFFDLELLLTHIKRTSSAKKVTSKKTPRKK